MSPLAAALVTELSQSGESDEMIMSIAGHIPDAILSCYSHMWMEAKRRALDEIAARQRAADEKRKSDTEQAESSTGASESAVLSVITVAGKHGPHG
jgi:hypothetical protein